MESKPATAELQTTPQWKVRIRRCRWERVSSSATFRSAPAFRIFFPRCKSPVDAIQNEGGRGARR